MRAYATVRGAFWNRGSGKKLRGNPEAQVLALYLLTTVHGTACGIFHIAIPTIANDTGLSEKQIRDSFSSIAEIAQYDEEEELCWIPNAAREQIGELFKAGDKRRNKLEQELRQFSGHRFLDLFHDTYSDVYEIEIPVGRGMRDGCMGHPQTVEAPSSDTVQYSTSSKGGVGGDPDPPKRSRRKPLRAIPEDWSPADRHLQKCQAGGIDCALAAEKFRNHALEKDRRCADWGRAFDNWLLNERPGGTRAATGASGVNSAKVDVFERARTLRAAEGPE